MTTLADIVDITLDASANAWNLYLEPFPFFRRQKNGPDMFRIDALIGAKTRFIGNIESANVSIRIDGSVIGDITCPGGTVVLAKDALIEGNLQTAFAIINGSVSGDIRATSAVELQLDAEVYGAVYAPAVEMSVGAKVRGRIETTETPGSETYIALTNTARAIADEAPRFRIVK
jgi:cytoskeletal protein CcmA (bactofilin family)